MTEIEDKLKFLLKKARLQGFVGISDINEIAKNPDEESILCEQLQKNGIEINHFLRNNAKNYKTASYSSKKDAKFSLTTRIDEHGNTFLLNEDSEKELFKKMSDARNKMLEFAFASIEIQDYIKKLAEKIENNTIKISTIVNHDKDGNENLYKTLKENFLKTVKELETGNKNQIIDLLFSLDFNDKTKSTIYNKFTQTPNYNNEIKHKLYYTEQTYSDTKHEIIEANIRLVFSIAKEYSLIHRGILDISDIIQEGNIGLIEAVESFDYKKGYKFSSWAVWYIRRQIWTAVNSFKKFVYVPPKASTDLYKILQFEEKYRLQKGENPTIQEIAEEFHLKERQVLSLLATNFENLDQNNESTVTRIDPSEETGEFSDDSNNPFNIISGSRLKKDIRNLLNKISERERRIIQLYFGLEENSDRLNLAEIGEIYGISRERVRQIIEKAIENIKELNADIIKEWK